MCGIVGQIRRQPAPEKLRAMLAAVAHRGPDGEGTWSGAAGEWSVELGHRRLSIIDLATGAQPMRKGDCHITYNGEVYNFAELRRELETTGSVFHSRSDTEVVLESFRRHGLDGLARLNGMFAFAVWDHNTRRLVLARDRAGVKPLYYSRLADGGIAFGSELSSVLIATGPRALSQEAIVSYFFVDYVHRPLAMAEGVYKLAPGHAIVWQDGVLGETQAFWKMPPLDDKPPPVDLWRVLGDSVERQLVADVPVGVFLSGGIDSSAVAALAAARAPTRLKAFTIGFADPTYDETHEAETVARAIGVEHITARLDEQSLLDVIEIALAQLDEPLADPSLLPTYLLSRLAAQHVKVVLSGDGGDELFGGYPTYRAHIYARYYAAMPRVVHAALARLIDRLPIDDRYQSLEWKLRHFTQRWDQRWPARHLRWLSGLDVPELVHAIRHAHPEALIERITTSRRSRDMLADVMALDFATYLPGSVLTKVDRAAMAHGLEARPALLDNAVIDCAFALPSRFAFRGVSGKMLLKHAARGHLPEEIIWRKKKGLGMPLARWLRGPLREKIAEVIARSPAWDSGVLERHAFVRYEKEHMERRADHAKPLWALLVFDRWLRKHRQHLLLGAA